MRNPMRKVTFRREVQQEDEIVALIGRSSSC